jgi:hypothetical protein
MIERQEITSKEQAHANYGADHAAVTGASGGSFELTTGLHSTGQSHIDKFTQSINMAGGVRQANQYVSEAAPGVGRANINGNHAYDHIHVQDQGVGESFLVRQKRRLGGHGG